jgi:MOSC domain-containing protein YiiM
MCPMPSATPTVTAVSRSATHTFSKPTEPAIRLIEGVGVEGDAHAGRTVKHRSMVARDPDMPNRRQVHLVHAELHDELRRAGFHVGPGQMGENVTTAGIDLLGLPSGARLHLGAEAVIEVTGLRTPCRQLDDLEDGLMAACLDRADDGTLVRKSGVMAVVLQGGTVRPGDPIVVEAPPGDPRPLQPV